MEKWKGKVAVITGASAGIGAAIVKDLASNGITVIGLARRPEKIEEMVKDFPETYAKVYSRSCDVTSLESVKDTFEWIESEFKVVNILVNNAGIGRKTTILNENSEVDKMLTDVINTNFTGLVHATRQAYGLMKKSDDYSLIVNINSIAGHKVPFPAHSDGQQANVYHATKHAVTAVSEILRQELIFMKNEKIRVTSLSPGVVDTDFFQAGKFLPDNTRMKGLTPTLDPDDISNVILYLLQLPYHVNLTEVTVRPVGEPF